MTLYRNHPAYLIEVYTWEGKLVTGTISTWQPAITFGVKLYRLEIPNTRYFSPNKLEEEYDDPGLVLLIVDWEMWYSETKYSQDNQWIVTEQLIERTLTIEQI